MFRKKPAKRIPDGQFYIAWKGRDHLKKEKTHVLYRKVFGLSLAFGVEGGRLQDDDNPLKATQLDEACDFFCGFGASIPAAFSRSSLIASRIPFINWVASNVENRRAISSASFITTV